MRIALIVPGGVDQSGEVRVIPALVSLIRRLAIEHDLHVFATHQEGTPGCWILEGARIHNLGLPRTPWRAVKMVLAEHRKARFDLVQSIWAGTTGALAVGLGKLLGLPSLVHVAGGELVGLMDIAYGGCKSWRGRALQRAVLKTATVVTAASEPICGLVIQRGVKVHRLPLGVDLERWPPRRPVRRLPNEPARLVHVASLNAVKDQCMLLQALRIIASRQHAFRLDIVGEDTLDGRIQFLVKELGLSDHVYFHGFLTQAQLRPIVEAAHVALISSRHEAGPLVVLEAAVAGVPTIGTAVGHLAEWHPDAALAVPCQDAAALALALESVLVDEELRMRLANAAFDRAVQEDAEQTALAFNALYCQMVIDRV